MEWERMVMDKKIVGLFIIVGSLWAQDLRTAWEDYVSTDTELAGAIEEERVLLEQQNELEKEIRSLKENQSWYNGWINEMRLSRKSSEQVALASSLDTVQGQISLLSFERQKAFLSLKRIYRQIVETQDLSQSDKAAAISLGRMIIARSDRPLNFPDYSSLLTGPFEDKEIKRLVMQDLQSVLRMKLNSVDSLLTEKRSERKLVLRLNEFHRDLALQLESDRDLGSGRLQQLGVGRASEEPSEGEILDNRPYAGFWEDDFSAVGEPKSGVDVSVPQDQVTQENPVDSPLELGSIERDIDLLESKRHQYRELLRQIEKELAD